jgi:isoaspartyl peptidase/L-asparaginase-like protein (Ntn-hydrolase superfamily)
LSRARQPIAIATWEFGRLATRAAGAVLAAGGRALDAVELGANAVERAPEVASVGLGGLPNARGVVELDALIMDGATLAMGAVAALQRIATPISVARRLLELAHHPFLAGEGALEFARAQGFAEVDLLTEASRRRWESWRERGAGAAASAVLAHDTVGVVALDAAGHLAAGCSTSGLGFKAPGRVGDSPLVGAGAYCDDEAGGAAATGNGDAMMRFLLSYAAVEGMRRGLEPTAACRAALARMRARGVRAEAALVALDREGRPGAAAIGRASFPFALWTPARDEIERVEEAPER